MSATCETTTSPNGSGQLRDSAPRCREIHHERRLEGAQDGLGRQGSNFEIRVRAASGANLAASFVVGRPAAVAVKTHAMTWSRPSLNEPKESDECLGIGRVRLADLAGTAYPGRRIVRYDRRVIGYHACAKEIADRLLLEDEPFKPSANEWDWLGHGI
jgi:hypothetical protein